MKILWLIPPLEGFPNISQYRFFKRMPIKATVIYPYLAASGVTLLSESGHDVTFLDCPTLELNWMSVNPMIKEVDLVILEARTPIMKEIWDTIWRIKYLNKTVKVALYGDHVTWNPQESLKAGADYIIQGGDYDWGALQLADLLAAGPQKKGVFNFGLVQDLDKLPWVDRELVDWHPYFESWKTRDVFLWNMSMRGCYYRCVYCAWAGTLWDRKLRKRSPSEVAKETAALHSQHGDCEILDDADLFDTEWGVEYSRQLHSLGLDRSSVKWGVQTHPNMIRSLEDLREMRAAGLEIVKLGLESGNDMSLWKMKKGLTIAQSERAIRLLQRADIPVHANLVVGWPWETKEEAYHTVEWIKSLHPNQAQFSLLIPYPNTELFEMAKANGWLTVMEGNWSKFDASKPMLRMEGMTNEEIIKLYQDSWRMFYLDRKFIWDNLKGVRSWSQVKKLYHGFRSVVYGHMRAVES